MKVNYYRVGEVMDGATITVTNQYPTMWMTSELRKAIAIHHTDTTDAAWDGGMMTKRCPAEAASLRLLHAWIDPEGDTDSKGSYKFPHHMVSAGGDVGAANMKACQSGIGVLNGGMGGADIPDADRRGVYTHLAAHLKDGDLTPPELKAVSFSPLMERRSFDLDEIRASEEDGAPKITGHAAVFNQPTILMTFMDGWQMIEQINPGAFKESINTDDIRALFNHDPNYVLGRNTADTLSLKEDRKGLAIETLPPNTQWARDLMQSMDRKDITQMSFGFKVIKDKVEEDKEKKTITRTLQKAQLFDVSVVTFPAYPQTDASVRSLIDRVTAEFPFLTQESQGEGEQKGNENKDVPVELLFMELELLERV